MLRCDVAVAAIMLRKALCVMDRVELLPGALDDDSMQQCCFEAACYEPDSKIALANVISYVTECSPHSDKMRIMVTGWYIAYISYLHLFTSDTYTVDNGPKLTQSEDFMHNRITHLFKTNYAQRLWSRHPDSLYTCRSMSIIAPALSAQVLWHPHLVRGKERPAELAAMQFVGETTNDRMRPLIEDPPSVLLRRVVWTDEPTPASFILIACIIQDMFDIPVQIYINSETTRAIAESPIPAFYALCGTFIEPPASFGVLQYNQFYPCNTKLKYPLISVIHTWLTLAINEIPPKITARNQLVDFKEFITSDSVSPSNIYFKYTV